MWFAFGFVTLIAGTAFFFYQRWSVSWTGTPKVHLGVRYQKQEVMGKERVAAVRVSVPVPNGYRFELKRESALDQFFKRLGLSVEFQFGQLGFDKLVYVASNDDHLINRLANSPVLRASAVELFQTEIFKHRLKGVFCAHGRLWLDIRNGNRLFGEDADADEMSHIAERLLPHLEQMAKALRDVVPDTSSARSRDKYLFRAVVLLSISSALTANGIGHALRTAILSDAFTLDTFQLWGYAVVCGLIIIGLMLVATVVLLGGSARAHLVLIELVLVGSLGAVLTSWAELRDMNIELDTAQPELREATIVGMHTSRSRRGGTSYYLQVPNWHPSEEGVRNISVSSSFYTSASVGNVLQFSEHQGHLGIRWATLRGLKPG